MNRAVRSALTNELGRLGHRRAPSVGAAIDETMPVGGGRVASIDRTHHIGVLDVEHHHIGRVCKRIELNDRRADRQPLIRYRSAAIDGRLREDVIEVERGHKVGGLPATILRRAVGKDLHLEVVGLLPLDAVPFVQLLQFRRLVGLRGLVHLTVLHQPVAKRLPDQHAAQGLRQFLQFPLRRGILGILACRGSGQAFPVI